MVPPLCVKTSSPPPGEITRPSLRLFLTLSPVSVTVPRLSSAPTEFESYVPFTTLVSAPLRVLFTSRPAWVALRRSTLVSVAAQVPPLTTPYASVIPAAAGRA